jgi:Uma2 family endonuclease
MTAMTMQIPKGEIVETADHRVQMHAISWEHYELLLEIRGPRPRPRMAYLDGELELMTTSQDHERLKCWIRALAEVYMLEAGIDFSGYGSYTMKQAPKRAGAEADQCYRIGRDQSADRFADLAIEVVWTHGGISKLEIYRRLGVREVWFWEDEEIAVHALRDGAYVEVPMSAVIPGIDLALVATFLDEPVMSDAMQKYRAALQSLRT